jgi:alpha-L-fucosidase
MKDNLQVTSDERLAWWREARFGMMITWGIFALEAAGEWVQYKRRIPVREYERLATRFNPLRFDAGEWVRCAKQAGMKYLVAMAKHHDGFAMFPSKVSSYNIVEATPWKRDFLKELADTCREEGLRFGLYYSHVREWHHPHATSLDPHTATHYGNYGNFWDYPHEEHKDLQIFLNEVSLPQLREVLVLYRPDLLWFDTPSLLRPDQAAEFYSLVRSLCPDCLINSRIGKTADSDYLSCSDNEIPELDGIDFETPMVMNGAWGHNTHAEKVYLPTEKFLNDLIATASRGGNYLLNVGPDPLGCFQDEAKTRLKEIGDWMDVHGEAIYGTVSVPLREPAWGKLTSKKNADVLYLFVQRWQSEIVLRGLESAVSRCTLLSTGQDVNFAIRDFAGLTRELVLTPPEGVFVIRVELAEPLHVCAEIIEDELGAIEMKASHGNIEKGPDSCAILGASSAFEGWRDDDVRISWQFTAAFDGVYVIEAELKTDFFGEWDSGYTIHTECAGQQTSARFDLPEGYVSKLCSYETKALALGSIALKRGRHELTISASDVAATLKTWRGVTLASVTLHRQKA